MIDCGGHLDQKARRHAVVIEGHRVADASRLKAVLPVVPRADYLASNLHLRAVSRGFIWQLTIPTLPGVSKAHRGELHWLAAKTFRRQTVRAVAKFHEPRPANGGLCG